MADLQRPIPAAIQADNGLWTRFRDELASKAQAIGSRLRYLRPGIVSTDVTLVFDGDPVDVDLDAAIAAWPELPDGIGEQFAATANVPEHVEIVTLAPGEHVGLRVILAVSLAGPPSKDGIAEALLPVWREPGGDVQIGQPLRSSASRISNIALDFAVQQLGGADVGVAISFLQRASGTVRVLALDVQELYRKDLP